MKSEELRSRYADECNATTVAVDQPSGARRAPGIEMPVYGDEVPAWTKKDAATGTIHRVRSRV
jgi:hypothetical protein